jgi:hypothetical protein
MTLELTRVRTGFTEFRGVYESKKASALAQHLRDVANIVGLAQRIGPCSACGDYRRLLTVQEWTENSGQRAGQWLTEVETEPLP